MLKEIGSPENQTFYTKVSPHAHIKLPFRFKKKTRTVITWNQCVLKGKFESRSFKELKQKTIFRKKSFIFKWLDTSTNYLHLYEKNSWSSKSISFHRALLETQAVKFRIKKYIESIVIKKGSNFCMKKSRQDCICFVTVVSLLRVKRTQSNFSQKMATLLVLVLHCHQQKQ